MSADEEDVVFEGSQIHQHLMSVGFTDYASVTRQKETIRSPLHTYFNNKKSILLSPIFSLLGELQRKFKIFGALTETKYWERRRLYELMVEIFHCPLLNKDDARWMCYSIDENNSRFNSPLVDFDWLDFWGSVWGDLFQIPTATTLTFGLVSWSIQKRCHEMRLQHLKDLLHTLRIFSRDAKKAFILVQEHELIQRGFIMAQSGAHVWRLEEASPGVTPSLPALRSTLSSTLREVNTQVLKATHALSCAQILQPLLRNEVNNMSTLEKDIDPMSLVSLKTQFHKSLALQSQLLRHLALCICPSAWLEPFEGQLSPQVFPICTDLNLSIKPLYNELSLCLRVSIAGDIRQSSSTCRPREPRLLSLYVALHSASLHAQALLAHALAAEDLTVDADEIHQDLGLRLTASLAEMTACNSCLQEAQLRLTKLTQPSCSDPVFVPPSPSLPPSVPTQIIPVGFTDLEPRGEDQVFEAICNRELTKFSDSESDDEEIGKQLKTEREVSRYLYMELQSVLAVRAKDWQVREARALGVPLNVQEELKNVPDTKELNTLNKNIPQSEELNIPDIKELKVPYTEESNIPDTEELKVPETEELNIPQPEEFKVSYTEELSIPYTEELNILETAELKIPDTEELKVPETSTEYIIDLPSPKSIGSQPSSWPLTRLPQKPKGPSRRNSSPPKQESKVRESVKPMSVAVMESVSEVPMSVAVMVAARARQLEQNEETFGDEEDEGITVE